jgi:hypothetical protein
VLDHEIRVLDNLSHFLRLMVNGQESQWCFFNRLPKGLKHSIHIPIWYVNFRVIKYEKESELPCQS